MGFRKQDNQYRLKFEPDTPLHGLEVLMRTVDVGTMLDMAELADMGESVSAKDVGKLAVMFQTLADAIVEWNYEDDHGDPIPPDFDGVRRLEMADAITLVHSWVNAAAGVSAPLPVASNDGQPSEEALIPMAPLSLSQVS